MSLQLDARQRAMLQEMGITVWSDGAAPHETVPDSAAAPAARGKAPDNHPHTTMAPAVAPLQPPAPRAAPAASSVAPLPAGQAASGMHGGGLVLRPPQPLYPTADPSQVPTDLGSGWLIVTECTTPAQPLAGDTGRLLDNMLRAMQLHRHPRVFLCAVERAGVGATAADDAPVRLPALAAALQPSMVLLLGHVAARAALGTSEPLGRLRAGPHQVAGFPAIVTYDAAFLLRSQDNKAAAWADLCRALALVRG